MLPLVLTGAFAQGRWGPPALASGLVVSFTVIGVGVAAFGHLVGLNPQVVRQLAAVLLLLSGLVLVHPGTQTLFVRLTTPFAGSANSLLDRFSLDGAPGQLTVGLLLGAVWSPCVGPTLGAAIGLAAEGRDLGRTTLIMAVFAIGMASVFLGFAYASRKILDRRQALAKFGARARKVFGWLLVVVGAMILSGADKTIEALLLGVLPDWLIGLTTMI